MSFPPPLPSTHPHQRARPIGFYPLRFESPQALTCFNDDMSRPQQVERKIRVSEKYENRVLSVIRELGWEEFTRDISHESNKVNRWRIEVLVHEFFVNEHHHRLGNVVQDGITQNERLVTEAQQRQAAKEKRGAKRHIAATAAAQ
ncbi:hypothetical protein Scep_002316 [Stephania cephalantha]|uniref:Uncharacterized protein n=1 Tax=Stephania cephalantha TaxID=152367 RepID=A0AAP0Q4J0_9MAGN